MPENPKARYARRTPDAVGTLKRGCLGLGELHDKSGARLLAVELINGGHVRHLLLELPPDQASYLSSDLLHHIDARSTGEGVRNGIPLSSLIKFAWTKNTNVVCADNNYANTRMGEQPRYMETRNETLVGHIMACSPANGILALWGVAHFRENTKFSTVSKLMMPKDIHFDWIDLSGY